jgi:hypothetical protein
LALAFLALTSACLTPRDRLIRDLKERGHRSVALEGSAEAIHDAVVAVLTAEGYPIVEDDPEAGRMRTGAKLIGTRDTGVAFADGAVSMGAGDAVHRRYDVALRMESDVRGRITITPYESDGAGPMVEVSDADPIERGIVDALLLEVKRALAHRSRGLPPVVDPPKPPPARPVQG